MNVANAEEISISDFMQGLESLVGTDLRGPPRDLDVASLSFRLKAKTRGARSDGALHDRSTEVAGGEAEGSVTHISAAMAVLSPTSVAKREKKARAKQRSRCSS